MREPLTTVAPWREVLARPIVRAVAVLAVIDYAGLARVELAHVDVFPQIEYRVDGTLDFARHLGQQVDDPLAVFSVDHLWRLADLGSDQLAQRHQLPRQRSDVQATQAVYSRARRLRHSEPDGDRRAGRRLRQVRDDGAAQRHV